MAIFIGIVLVVIGSILIGLDYLGVGAVLFISGLILLLYSIYKYSKNKETNSGNTPPSTKTTPSQRTTPRSSSSSSNQSWQDKIHLTKNGNSYKLELQLREDNNYEIYTYHVFIGYVVSIYGQVKHLPIRTTNNKYWSDADFEFSFVKEGTRRDLNNTTINIKANELVRPLQLGSISAAGFSSQYVILIVVKEKQSQRKVIEKIDTLNLNITKCLSDKEQTFIYGMERFIELGYIIAKADGNYSPKERKIINAFIETNATAKVHADFHNFLRNIEGRPTRSFDTVIHEIKGSIGAIQLVTKGMELLVNLSVSDGEIEPKEEAYLKKFANAFGFSDDDYQKLITKYVLKNNDFTLSLQLFGISNEMSATEKKRLLNQAYAEWNRKIISSNPETKKRAQMVIEYISQERLKL